MLYPLRLLLIVVKKPCLLVKALSIDPEYLKSKPSDL